MSLLIADSMCERVVEKGSTGFRAGPVTSIPTQLEHLTSTKCGLSGFVLPDSVLRLQYRASQSSRSQSLAEQSARKYGESTGAGKVQVVSSLGRGLVRQSSSVT